MDYNNAAEKFNTNLESSEPGLQNRLYLKLLGPTLKSKKGSENVTMDFIDQYCARNCVRNIALSNYWNTNYTALLQNPKSYLFQ